jgi:hypothetical protein
MIDVSGFSRDSTYKLPAYSMQGATDAFSHWL